MEKRNTMAELAACSNIRYIGIWKDPEGTFPAMPLFEMSDEPAEVWNEKVRKKE